MQRGLEGRRIALCARDEAPSIRRALEDAGALVEVLLGNTSLRDEDWHGGRYAALVVGGCVDHGLVDPRVLQLLREFLVSDKPVAVFGQGLSVLEQAGGTPADADIAFDGGDLAEFTRQLVADLSNQMDERQVDEMSEQSFPASDPPSTTPPAPGTRETQAG